MPKRFRVWMVELSSLASVRASLEAAIPRCMYRLCRFASFLFAYQSSALKSWTWPAIAQGNSSAQVGSFPIPHFPANRFSKNLSAPTPIELTAPIPVTKTLLCGMDCSWDILSWLPLWNLPRETEKAHSECFTTARQSEALLTSARRQAPGSFQENVGETRNDANAAHIIAHRKCACEQEANLGGCLIGKCLYIFQKIPPLRLVSRSDWRTGPNRRETWLPTRTRSELTVVDPSWSGATFRRASSRRLLDSEPGVGGPAFKLVILNGKLA